MPERSGASSPPSVTRRQLRESRSKRSRHRPTGPVRRRAVGGPAASGPAPASPTRRGTGSSREASWSQILGEREPAPEMSANRPVSRRELRTTGKASRSRRRSTSRGGLRRAATRSAIVTALAASTIVIPLLGTFCIDPAHAHPGETRQLAPATTPDATGTTEQAATRARPIETPDDVPSAAPDPSRSKDQASRSAEREPAEDPQMKAMPELELLAEEGPIEPVEPAEPAPTFVLPLAQDAFRLSSSYGGRADPFNGAAAFHEGVDLAAPMDTPIYAVADGVVDYVGPGKDGRSSMIIVVAHEIEGQRVYSWYNHMYADDLYVQEGQGVAAGEVIAGVGSNGRSTGPHLHFEIHTDDELTTTDPLAWLQELGAVDISALS